MRKPFALVLFWALVLIPILSAAFPQTRRGQLEDDPSAKYRQTMDAMRDIAVAIGNYVLDFGYAPKVETAGELRKLLDKSYIKSLPQDAWGNDFHYAYDKSRPERYWLGSSGSDSVFNGFDQRGRWTAFQGNDLVLTNAIPYWLYAPDMAALPLPEVGPDSSFGTRLNPGTTLGLVRHPGTADYSEMHGGKLSSLPSYDPNSDKGWQVDLRSTDLSGLDLRDRLADLLRADFDSKTKWPDVLPPGFVPSRIMELGEDPGLGIRRLHERGITGKGVGIAIIDQTLLTDHFEYKDRLRLYEEIHNPNDESAMHGPAVASIAVGRTAGVAPEADLYYIAETHGTYRQGKFEWDFGPLAQSISRILDINRSLPAHEKIRVISVSVGWSPEAKGYADVTAAVDKAREERVFVISSSLYRTSGRLLFFHGLDRDPNADPEKAESFGPGTWWSREFYAGKPQAPGNLEMLLVPMDSRCTASPTGVDDYVFYRQGGWSWVIPYIAGLYALSCQVNPATTPESFWAKALKTGTTIKVAGQRKKIPLGKIIDPEKFFSIR